MANIGQATVLTTWVKIENLIPNFTPTADAKYIIQNKSQNILKVCESITNPSKSDLGFKINPSDAFEWKCESGVYLWLASASFDATFNIAEA